ncbi:MAG: HU family DNA-binding protein [Ignavibacteria bacterium]|nr:HU family DNA-binding protein [Ignavibacteria bacterium]
MNKEQLIDNIASDAKITKVAARAALESFIESVTRSLRKGDKVSLVGFGTFSVSKRNARSGRNPKTGASINIPAKLVARFKAGKALSDAVNR